MKQAIKTVTKVLKRKVVRLYGDFTQACAPYEVRDNYGTRIATWTVSGAFEWLPACGDVAIIVHRPTNELIASRTESN